MKYPLVRVEEMRKAAPGGDSTAISQNVAVADHVIVRLQPGAKAHDLQKVAEQNGLTLLKAMHSDGVYLVQIPNATLDSLPNAIESLNQWSDVLKYAEQDSIVHSYLVPNDPNYSGEWGLNNTGQTSGTPDADIDAPEAWSVINSSPNVVVAVIDSGIDFNHPDLAANIWTNPHPGSYGGYTNDQHGWNFYADNNSPQDDNFHGTHVSGTIGAVGNNGVGVTGVSWQVKIMPLKFLASNGSGYTSDAVDAVNYATAMGAKIMSNSWGGGPYSQALKDAIDAANTAGALFVAAAGNDQVNTDVSAVYPACYASPNIISVAATDTNDQLASFSNYGASTVNMAAPGVGILSTVPIAITPAMTSEGLPTSYGLLSGTSMAAPLVSGAAALALAQNPVLTVAELKSHITQRVDLLSQLVGRVKSYGRLNLYNIVNTGWVGNPAELRVAGTAMDDSEGDGDGAGTPGEIIHLTPVINNFGGTVANNVTVQLVAQQSAATVLNGTYSVGTLLPGQDATVATPFRVQLSSTAVVGTTLTFDVVLQGTGISPMHGSISVVVTAPRGYSQRSVAFTCGEITADPARNLVYVVDQTNHRVLAVNTDLGQIVAATNIDANVPAAMLAVSIDGTKLYLAIPTAQKIQVFSLPSLASAGDLAVNAQPFSLACGTGGQLYMGTGGGNTSGKVYGIDSSNGAILQTFPSDFFGQYHAPLLRTNAAGTKLYIAETGVSGGVNLKEFDVSGVTAVLSHNYNYTSKILIDMILDEAGSRIYMAQAAAYAMNYLDLATGNATTTWPQVGSYAEAVAFVPGSNFVYGAAGDTSSGGITQYNRSTGEVLRTYATGATKDRGLAMTANGRVLYVKSGGQALGIIGAPSFVVTNPPPVTMGPNLNLSSVSFSDVEGNGDGVPNDGEVIKLTPTVANNGGQDATNVAVALSGDANATLLSSASQTVSSIGAGASAATPDAFRIQLTPGLSAGTVVHFTFTVTPAGGTAQTYTYQLGILPKQVINSAATSMQVGEILADQQRNIVYMVDKSDMKLLAFDTNAGHVTATAPLGPSQTINWKNQPPAMMAESVDGAYLYLAIPQTNTIAAFALPALTPAGSKSYSFQPVSLACDAQGRVYCSTTDPAQKLVQIDASNGAILNQFGPTTISSTTLLRRNAAGTELDVSERNGSSQSYLHRFSTSGAGVPTQIAALLVGSQVIADFAVNESASLFYVVMGDNSVTSVPFDGGGLSSWPISGGTAVSILPGNSGVLSDSQYTPGAIYFFDPHTGRNVFTYDLGASSYAITNRGLATTPNGRTLYLAAQSSSSNTIDNYIYCVGLIGGSLDLQLPGESPISLQSLAVTDPAPGSNDGFVHPGQTIQLAPVFKNFLNIQITNVSVELTTNDSWATIQAPSSSTIGTVNSFATFAPAPAYSVAISSSATDGHAIPVNFVVSYNNGSQQTLAYTLYVSAPTVAQSWVHFQIGAMIADPIRNLAYVVNRSEQRLIAVDTATGNATKAVRLLGDPINGQMAISRDGSRLYLAISGTTAIQAFSLPDLQEADVINLTFMPYGIAIGSDGKLYATPWATYDNIFQIDPATGQTLGSFRQSYQSYGGAIIRSNSDGSALYTVTTGVTGIGTIDCYHVNSSGYPTFANAYNFTLENTYDLAIDDTYHRIYSSGGGTYGVGITSTLNGNFTLWFTGTWGSAACFLNTGPFVYAGANTSIRRFDRERGVPLSSYSLAAADGNYTVLPRALVVTPNGRVLYGSSAYVGGDPRSIGGYFYRLGLLGASSLTIAPSTVAPSISTGENQNIRLSQSASLSSTTSGSTTGLPVAWRVMTGPAGSSLSASSNSVVASFSAVGDYIVGGTTTDGGTTGTDLVKITVSPDLAAVSVATTMSPAINGVVDGQFTFNRTGQPQGNLTVAYAVSGTAVANTDYVALTGTVTIPDGASSVSVPVVAKAGATANGTIIATVTASSAYQVGVSQQATVLLGKPSFANWVAANLSGYDAAQQTIDASPAKDGISNLMKYAFGLNPTLSYSPSAAGMPSVQLQTFSTEKYLTITYTALQDAPDLSYIVEVSSDLVTWNSGASYTTQVSATLVGAVTKTIVVRDQTPISAAGTRFIRVRVVKN